jgi:hypothetical protein
MGNSPLNSREFCFKDNHDGCPEDGTIARGRVLTAQDIDFVLESSSPLRVRDT